MPQFMERDGVEIGNVSRWRSLMVEEPGGGSIIVEGDRSTPFSEAARLTPFLHLALKRVRGRGDLVDFRLCEPARWIAAPTEATRTADSSGRTRKTPGTCVDYVLICRDRCVAHNSRGIRRRIIEVLRPLPSNLAVESAAMERSGRLNR